ncbi:MAG: HAMP domain-containing histidine kinase [Gammaproteobacteria bacterium]|nr:HAMP domain-containing histidine kinase [Gammaproteobacteria bacterium]
MALIHYLSLNELEELLVNEHVKDEMHYFVELTDKNSNISQLYTQKFTAYKKLKGESIDLFPFLHTLKPGMHELDFKRHTYTIAVNENNENRYYILYDETDFEDREYFLLVTLSLSILLAILFSLWFGYWISGKIISPITRLANQVGELQAPQLNVVLSDDYADDEVKQLAETFDGFIKKLHLFVERERSFTADASHELRTPLAIIQGAVEVIIAKDNLSDDDKKRVERIERAARDMSQNLTALLVLAREPTSEIVVDGNAELSQIIEDAIQSFHHVYSSKDVELNINLIDQTTIKAPSNIVSILISNIIRNAFLYTDKGSINITLKNNKLEVSDTGAGILEEDLSRIFEQGYRGKNALGPGSGLGLSLAKRICDYYGWKISIESIIGAGTTVTWSF